MKEPEPEPELQATANLSPVSPCPVHTAAPFVVPALQDTVDTIDAMVAAVAQSNGLVDDTIVDPAMAVAGEGDDVVDDDSFNEAYGHSPDAPESGPEPHQTAPGDNDDDNNDDNDDYAKTFDSPIEPEEEDGQGVQQHVSSVPRESNDHSLSPDHLKSHLSAASHVAPDPSSTHPAASAGAFAATAAVHPSAAQLEADSQLGGTTPSQPSEPQHIGSQRAPSQPTVGPDSSQAGADSSAADIQQLVADLTSQSAEPSPGHDPSAPSIKDESPAGSASLPSTAFPSSSSLPPRPPLPHSTSQSYPSQHHPAGSNANVAAPPTPGQPSTYVAAGAPGTSTEAISNLPPPPATGLNAPTAIASLNAPPYPSAAPGFSAERPQEADFQHEWEQFMADERQYMSEAKWDRFPEGSRIFIGNLSSDKVSKRDVFDMFHKFGRLAQISLKSAYGFVQYHTVDEGSRAMENLQGIEIRGRRIHLEISRAQDKGKKERRQSPDRNRGRDSGRDSRDGGRKNDKYGQQNRDDYRPGRTHSPRRSDYSSRDDGSARDRGFYDSGRSRGRSRSPGYGRNDKESYRRRSPSPYSRSRHGQENELDLPRRYGAEVPDVQIILQPEVNRDFVGWVESALKAKGLKTEVMYLHPRFPKDQVIQRQAVEGVHAVVDLDLRAQNLGRVPVQAFDRSGGPGNVRFDQYVDLDPGTAAEVILRAKASGPVNYGQAYGGAGAGAGGYPNPYGGQPQQQPQQHPQYSAMPPQVGYHPGQAPPPQHQQQQPLANNADLASLMGQVDNATLQRLLSSIQPTQGGMAGMPAGGPHGGPNPAAMPNQQVDIQAILGSLNGGAAPQQQPPSQAHYGAPYGAQPPAPNGGPQQGQGRQGDSAAQVQNIMAQLARFRQ